MILVVSIVHENVGIFSPRQFTDLQTGALEEFRWATLTEGFAKALPQFITGPKKKVTISVPESGRNPPYSWFTAAIPNLKFVFPQWRFFDRGLRYLSRSLPLEVLV
jgi:hypothetical protein